MPNHAGARFHAASADDLNAAGGAGEIDVTGGYVVISSDGEQHRNEHPGSGRWR